MLLTGMNFKLIILGEIKSFESVFKHFETNCTFFFSLSETNLAVTVTRSCVGVWELRSSFLLSKLADSHLGAIVTHAEITPDGKYIVSSETGKLLIWNRKWTKDVKKFFSTIIKLYLIFAGVTEQVLFRDDQPGIQQIKFLDGGERVLSISCVNINRKAEENENSDPLVAVARVKPKFKFILNHISCILFEINKFLINQGTKYSRWGAAMCI